MTTSRSNPAVAVLTNQECFKQVLIQQKATMLNLYITAIVTLPTVIAPLILGPWLAHFLKVLEFLRITNWNESHFDKVHLA